MSEGQPIKAPDAFRTISEVAGDLDLPQHVLRFWETRFTQIKPMKRGGGRRYYRPEDVDLLRGIRFLLYAEGFTIRGVQRVLKEKGVGFVAGAGQVGSPESPSASMPPPPAANMTPAPPPRPRTPLEPLAAAMPEPESFDRTGPPMTAEPPRPEAARPMPAGSALGKDSRRKLDAALAELLEAQRLLDQVR